MQGAVPLGIVQWWPWEQASAAVFGSRMICCKQFAIWLECHCLMSLPGPCKPASEPALAVVSGLLSNTWLSGAAVVNALAKVCSGDVGELFCGEFGEMCLCLCLHIEAEREGLISLGALPSLSPDCR